MNCQQTLMHGYADRELDVATTLAFEEHLRECDACSRKYEEMRALHDACASDGLYFELPAGLEQRIRSAARREMRTAGALRLAWRPWLAVAAAVLILAGLVVVLLLRQGTGAENALAEQVVADHVRSLLVPGRRVDVVSTDRHTVKPWLAGHVDFAPDVPDLSTEGFKLEGGRLDYLANRPVAALIYEYHKHVVDVFIWPADRTQASPAVFLQRQGYWLAHWTDAGLNHWAITDASEDALRDFVDRFRPGPASGRTSQ